MYVNCYFIHITNALFVESVYGYERNTLITFNGFDKQLLNLKCDKSYEMW